MTHVSGTADRVTPRAATTHSTNGGPPPSSPALRLALVAAAAFVIGALVARIIDWRTHAHPHD